MVKFWYCLLLLIPFFANANPVDSKHIQVALHSEVKHVKAGEPFWVGMRLTPDTHWHTYWQNPGDSGAAPKVKWTLPEGTQAGEIQWPAPQRIPVSHLVNLGYDGEVLLPIKITPPASLAGDTFAMTAQLKWLVCEEICIPGEAELKLDLPIVSSTPEKDSRWATLFATARDQLPEALATKSELLQTESGFRLTLDIPEQLKLDKNDAVWFLPVSNDLIEHAAPQPWMRDTGKLSIKLQASPYFTQLDDDYEGVLLLSGKAYQLTAPAAVETAEQAAQAALNAQHYSVSQEKPATSLWLIGLFAFAGGLLLNLMPCVLPVLSLKALSLVQHGQSHRTEQRMHGLSYTVGVVLSFVLIAAVLLALRAGGEQIGWGFQLQSPLFIALLVYLLFALGLSLSGLFNVGSSWMGFGESLSRRSGYSGSFFTGVLAVLVASPCTAPFMGTALGYAITQSTTVALSVFASLGLGMALPFLLLSFIPAWLRFLPKPGAWMETFKQLMAFPLYATALWLLWVLGRQVGVNGMTAALGGLILLTLGLWLTSGKTSLWRKIAVAVTLVSSLAMLTLPVFSPSSSGNTSATELSAEAYTPQKLQALRAEQKPVFVNLTADWCITCLVNEQVALDQPEVQQAFADNNVSYLKGDWTNRDDAITRLLSEHDRSGVPLYLYYAVGKDATILPQILTPDLVINALNSK